jgi:ferric-dicitrate binding protein FerR (iron transport regulator)
MLEARKWLFEIETREDLERIWPEFYAWFEASEEHRAAYAAARSRWLQLTGARPDGAIVRTASRAPRMRTDEWAYLYRTERHLVLAALLAVLVLTLGASGDALDTGVSAMSIMLSLLFP